MQPVAEALSHVRPGSPVQFQNLTLFPLLAPTAANPGYVVLDEALKCKRAHVAEVSESGRVPELLFVNDGDERVLLVDGEELIGARQNRILNVTLLVSGKTKVVIPVSCVEQGRWAYKSRSFESADRALFSRSRAKKVRQVNASLRESGLRYANQAEIWSDISAKAACLRVDSDTGAMADIYEQQRSRIEDYVRAFQPQSGQVGAVFAIDGQVRGIEFFDADTTFRKFMAKLVRSYAMDAIEEAKSTPTPPAAETVQRFIEDMQAAALQRFPALGEGEDLRLESDTIAGGALYADGRIVHLCAFSVEKPSAQRSRRGDIGAGGSEESDIPAFLRRGSRRYSTGGHHV